MRRIHLNKSAQFMFFIGLALGLSAPKLNADPCVDPELKRIPAGTKVTLCDGSTGLGTLDLSGLKPDVIRAGVSVGGITGTLAPIPNCSRDGDKNCIATSAFPAVRAASINPAKIAASVRIGGVQGTIPLCQIDGSSSCLLVTPYAAVNVAGLSVWDIRRGKTIGGVGGELAFLRNTYNDTIFGPASTPAAPANKAIATIDDGSASYGTAIVPTGVPSGWENYTIKASQFERVGVDAGLTVGYCNEAGDQCVMHDRMTDLYWSPYVASGQAWAAAVSSCDSSTHGGYSDWRLPTQKEMLQYQINGIKSLVSTYYISNLDYKSLSSTANSRTTTNHWGIYLSNGTQVSYAAAYNNATRTICVRP